MHLFYSSECEFSEFYRILQRSSKRDVLGTFSETGQFLNTKSVGDSQFKQKQNIQLLVLGYVFLYCSHFSSRVKICMLLSFFLTTWHQIHTHFLITQAYNSGIRTGSYHVGLFGQLQVKYVSLKVCLTWCWIYCKWCYTVWIFSTCYNK